MWVKDRCLEEITLDDLEESDVKMQADIVVMWPLCQGMLETN